MSAERDVLMHYRMARARETLAEADLMAQNGHWHGCVSRLYYACFYAVTALLLRHDLSAGKHAGVRGLVYAVTHGGAGGMLWVTRRIQPPLAVLVALLPTRLHPATALAPALALVLIVDPADSPVLAEPALQQLFALTAAEAGVALALAAGRSAEEIAGEREVSLPTVRTQIRQILEKTGALHLRDLVRLLAGLPTVRPPRTAP